eukprot:9691468-Alexandrium_andersonii.AAC.1
MRPAPRPAAENCWRGDPATARSTPPHGAPSTTRPSCDPRRSNKRHTSAAARRTLILGAIRLPRFQQRSTACAGASSISTLRAARK